MCTGLVSRVKMRLVVFLASVCAHACAFEGLLFHRHSKPPAAGVVADRTRARGNDSFATGRGRVGMILRRSVGTRQAGILTLQSALRSFSDDGIDYCRTGDAGGLVDVNERLDISAMAARLSYSGRIVEWVGEEPLTAGGKAWKQMCDALLDVCIHEERQNEGTELLQIGKPLSDTSSGGGGGVDLNSDSLFKVFKAPRPSTQPKRSEADLVVDAYSNFLGVTPPPLPFEADVQLAEIPLFAISKVLLPGGDFPIQINKNNLSGKEMVDYIAATKSRRFGVVTTPDFLTQPPVTLTERTLEDYTAASASASGGGPQGAEDALLRPSREFRRDSEGREIYLPRTRVFSRVGCLAEIYEEPTRLDDGRYIVETKGSLPFRIVDIVEEEPYPIAIVQLLRDPPIMQRTQDEELRASEISSWQALNDVCWLACELFDKRSWLPLLMQIDGKQHPLNKMKTFAPEERQAGAPLMLTKEAAAAAWMKRQQFSWELVRVLSKGVPGLWDSDFTGNKISEVAVLRLLQDLDLPGRIRLAETELKNARQKLRQHQRLRDIVEKRDEAPPGFH